MFRPFCAGQVAFAPAAPPIRSRSRWIGFPRCWPPPEPRQIPRIPSMASTWPDAERRRRLPQALLAIQIQPAKSSARRRHEVPRDRRQSVPVQRRRRPDGARKPEGPAAGGVSTHGRRPRGLERDDAPRRPGIQQRPVCATVMKSQTTLVCGVRPHPRRSPDRRHRRVYSRANRTNEVASDPLVGFHPGCRAVAATRALVVRSRARPHTSRSWRSRAGRDVRHGALRDLLQRRRRKDSSTAPSRCCTRSSTPRPRRRSAPSSSTIRRARWRTGASPSANARIR